MNYLIDTCVISELIKQQPKQSVVDFLKSIDEEKLFISSMTLGELHRGIQKLADSKKKSKLLSWLDGIEDQFDQRVLGFDKNTAIFWGRLMALMEKSGNKMSAFDSIIGVTAMANNLCLLTRNVKDFDKSGVEIINPWEI